jgi:purine-nucleoside phosphorylase
MFDRVDDTVEFLNEKVGYKPELAVILGSGLSEVVEQIENKIEIPFSEIPHFAVSTVKGHNSKLVFGQMYGKNVVAMSGRLHYYEGYTMKQITYPILALKVMGIDKLIITNSCGGINENLEPGSIMVIDDFINLVSDNPLIGENFERFGPRFPDMTEPYSEELMTIAEEKLNELGVNTMRGTYSFFQGPYYETKAEIRAIKYMGADAVGMSTVPESILANYLGLKTVGFACITNMATGIQKVKHSHENVLKVANQTSKNLAQVIYHVIKNA